MEWSATAPDDAGLIYATARDVTSSRRVRVHAAAIEAVSGVGSWEVDPDTHAVYWSRRTHAIHGTDPDRFRPTLEEALSFYPPEARAVIEPAVTRLKEDGEPYELELPLVTSAGERRWVRLHGAVERTGDRVSRAYGTIADITDRRAAEEALRREAVRHRLVQSLGGVGVGEYHVDDDLMVWDDVCWRIVGRDASGNGIDHATWTRGMHPDDIDRAEAVLMATLVSGAPFDVTFRYAHADGRWVHIRNQGNVIERHEDGRPRRVVAIVTDVTAQKEAEAETLRQRDRLDTLLALNPAVVYAAGARSLIPTYVSPTCRALFGADAAEILATPDWWVRHLHPDDRETMLEQGAARCTAPMASRRR
jgi:PAS domain S-box-containing protein